MIIKAIKPGDVESESCLISATFGIQESIIVANEDLVKSARDQMNCVEPAVYQRIIVGTTHAHEQSDSWFSPVCPICAFVGAIKEAGRGLVELALFTGTTAAAIGVKWLARAAGEKICKPFDAESKR